ncbi:glycosyltransferase [Microbulbifer sp. TRSA007]|uniref:glycosyltransferase n=1 Tax=Microbulbifer sp. TRSA007 TaxID=3243384 RepID=UPI00403A2CBC
MTSDTKENSIFKPEVEIVIVTYNRSIELLEQLQLLQQLDYPKSAYSITIVNNNSTDDTLNTINRFIQGLGSSEPRFKLLDLSQNTGGSGGFSEGIKHALHRGAAKYIWLLDDDATPNKETLNNLVSTAENKLGSCIVGGVILDKADPSIVTEAGARIKWWKARQQLLFNREKVENLPDKPFESEYSSAACMLVPLAAAKKLQSFANFFLHFDDVDWCLRASKAGFPTVIEPTASVIHPSKLSASRPGIRYYDVRNFLFVASWHYKLATPYLFIRFLLKGFFSLLYPKSRSQGREILKALLDFTTNTRGKMQ